MTVAQAAVSSLLSSIRRERQVIITYGHENTSPERNSHTISADCTGILSSQKFNLAPQTFFCKLSLKRAGFRYDNGRILSGLGD